MQEKKIKAGIVGGTGYTGVELLRLLSRHPNVEVCAITSQQGCGYQGDGHVPLAQRLHGRSGVYDARRGRTYCL